jgi:glycosyltransferase involved in cell wall biosynthesis
MRIALVSETYPSSVNPNNRAFVHARAQLYRSAGHEVQVFAQQDGEAARWSDFEGTPVARGSIEQLRSMIDAYQPEVVALHTPYAGTDVFRLSDSLVGQAPIVVWVHGYEALYTAFYGYHRGWRRYASIPWDMHKLRRLRRFLRKCHSVVYVSQWLQRNAERGMMYRHPRSHIIHNPIDLSQFKPLAHPASCKEESSPRGIALRSLRPVYGLDIAVRAYAQLPETELTIMGTGPLEGSLRDLIAQTESHSTLASQALPHAEIPELLRRFDYFVAPSRNETQGLAMCEAMACGLPVVATNVGGIPEFVRDGVDGYLVPPESSTQLRTAIHKLVSDPERMQVMGRNARAQMSALCNGELIAERELELLECARSLRR